MKAKSAAKISPKTSARQSLLEPALMIPQALKWLAIASVIGLLAGTASGGFLVALDWATQFREAHLWLIALLPVGGFAVGWVYHRFGTSVEAGNNLILDEIHQPKATIPLRMMPLVLWGTVMTHFFGGSAGREGTALQMSASLADQLTRPLKLDGPDRRILLMSGMAAGFASVFGTPLAGAIFGLEVLAIGRIQYEAIFPCFIAAIVADQVTLAWGVHHTPYLFSGIPQVTGVTLISAIAAGVCFGLVGMFFSRLTHGLAEQFKERVSYPPLRPLIGGAVVAAAVGLLGTTRYIGLGIPTMLEAFGAKLPPWDFATKLAFTAVTLGAGFKGGEVTPLFFIGATLGNALSYLLPIPTPLLSGMGFVAVFAGAANTPIACTFMAIELFGDKAGVFAGVACVVSYLFSGNKGIYHAQRLAQAKYRKAPES